MNITPNARTVLERRYLARNDKGEVTETVEDLFHRVARAIAARSPILMADEPTGALDSSTGREVLALFQRLNDMGNTILMILLYFTDYGGAVAAAAVFAVSASGLTALSMALDPAFYGFAGDAGVSCLRRNDPLSDVVCAGDGNPCRD